MRPYRRATTAPNREEEILEAATDLFFSKGYQASSLRELAAILDMNPATLYHYFESKDELLFRIQSHGIDVLMERARSALESTENAPVAERLRAFLSAHVSYHVDHYKLARLHVAEYRSLAPESRAVLRERLKEYERMLVDIVTEGVASGELISEHPKATAFAMLGAGVHVSNWYRPDGALSRDEIVRSTVDLLLEGVVRKREQTGPDQ